MEQKISTLQLVQANISRKKKLVQAKAIAKNPSDLFLQSSHSSENKV